MIEEILEVYYYNFISRRSQIAWILEAEEIEYMYCMVRVYQVTNHPQTTGRDVPGTKPKADPRG